MDDMEILVDEILRTSGDVNYSPLGNVLDPNENGKEELVIDRVYIITWRAYPLIWRMKDTSTS